MTALRTVLIGCGRIGAGYAADPVMACHYRYVSHAQVLADHPAFAWTAAIDRNRNNAVAVAARWNVPAAGARLEDIPDRATVEAAVLAVPPGERLAALDALPGLRAVLVEKPLGASLAEAESFAAACAARAITVQVNLPRRCDGTHRRLAEGGLARLIGAAQGATLVYGNGLVNNGTHMIDVARMLLGDVAAVGPAAGTTPRHEGPLDGDVNVPFAMRMRSGIPVFALPVAFTHYRENAIDIWGEHGRIALVQEGLRLLVYARAENRAMQGEHELVNDASVAETTTIGVSLRAVYDDLAEAVAGGRTPRSPVGSALATARIVEAVLRATRAGETVAL
jgi:predicted dehydrogenase